ncbi:MAG TPA: hypothetical protein VF582_05385 [Allosphingosinicella sp.]|jgi:hypothetical protein
MPIALLLATVLQAPSTTATVQGAANPDEVICKTKKSSTSRVPVRLCAQRKEWDKRARDSQEFIENARRPGTGGT